MMEDALIELTMNELWRKTIYNLVHNGQKVRSRNGPSRELLNWKMTLRDIEHNFLVDSGRALDPAYAAAEFLWYMSGAEDVEMMVAYAPSYANYAESTGIAWGAYGKRIKNTLKQVIQILRDHPDSRQAVLPIWAEKDVYAAHYVKDIPCTVALQFLRRKSNDGKEELHCVCTMRSNDAWMGMPYDIFCFTMLQRLVADELGIGYGEYHHNVGSMHLYEKHVQKATDCLMSMTPAAHLHHNWDKRFRLDEIESTVAYEEKFRTKGTHPELVIDGSSPSAANDLGLCCINGLNQFAIPNKNFCHSQILNTAWQIKNRKAIK